MDCVTNISQIEKIYCNSYNHDVKAPVVYADGSHLYADAEYTKPVDYKLLKDLFFAGVVIWLGDGFFARVTSAVLYDANEDVQLIAVVSGSENRFIGYDTKNDEWYNRMSS